MINQGGGIHLREKSLGSTAAAKPLQSWPALCDPIDGSPPGSPSLGFSRQEHGSGGHCSNGRHTETILSVGGHIKVHRNTHGNKSCLPRIEEIFLC